MAPNVAGIWVEGGGKVIGHGNIIRASSDIEGATVRGLVAIDGGSISSDNDDISAMVLAHLPDSDAPSQCTSRCLNLVLWGYFSEICQVQTLQEFGSRALVPRLMVIAARFARPVT